MQVLQANTLLALAFKQSKKHLPNGIAHHSGEMEEVMDESHKSHVIPQTLSLSCVLLMTLGKIFSEFYLTVKH